MSIHLKTPMEPVCESSTPLGSPSEEMLDGIGTGLLARLEPRAGVPACRSLEPSGAGHHQIVVREAEPRRTSAGDGAKLTFADQPGTPHLRRRVGGQVQPEITILVHGDLPLAKVDPVAAQQPLCTRQPFIVDDPRQPLVARAIGDVGSTAFADVELIAGGPCQGLDEAV